MTHKYHVHAARGLGMPPMSPHPPLGTREANFYHCCCQGMVPCIPVYYGSSIRSYTQSLRVPACPHPKKSSKLAAQSHSPDPQPPTPPPPPQTDGNIQLPSSLPRLQFLEVSPSACHTLMQTCQSLWGDAVPNPDPPPSSAV
mmetsp:Transcript_24608/g.44645  ORF Transcript_24608/g.44645 Transcript_24608/m.44645 type:complete len:142 (-) Transcript_24608:464-889(-)